MYHTFAILDLSTPDLVIVLAIVLVLFGSKKLPALSKGIGESIRELRKGIAGDDVPGKSTAVDTGKERP